VEPAKHAQQQGRAVACGEERHVEAHLAQSVQEKDHAEEKQQVVVARDHVLGAEVGEENQLPADVVAQELFVGASHAMGPCR
jgi:hypothetical protein